MSEVSYNIGLSKQMLNTMLNSDVPAIRKQAEEYIKQAEEQQQDNSGFLQKIKDIFSMGASAAEPDIIQPNLGSGTQTIIGADGSLQVVPDSTNTSSFPFVGISQFDGSNPADVNNEYMMKKFNLSNNLTPLNTNNTQSGFASNFPNITSTGTAVPFGTPVDKAQGFTQDTRGPNFQFIEAANEDLDEDSEEEYYKAKDQEGFFKQLLDFFGGGGVIGSAIRKGGDFLRNRPSQIAFNKLISGGYGNQLANIYGTGGIMQGYNPVSLFGKGPLESMRERRNKLLGRMLTNKPYSQKNLEKLNQAITSVGGDGGISAADLSAIGKKEFTGPGKAFEARNTGTGKGPK